MFEFLGNCSLAASIIVIAITIANTYKWHSSIRKDNAELQVQLLTSDREIKELKIENRVLRRKIERFYEDDLK